MEGARNIAATGEGLAITTGEVRGVSREGTLRTAGLATWGDDPPATLDVAEAGAATEAAAGCGGDVTAPAPTEGVRFKAGDFNLCAKSAAFSSSDSVLIWCSSVTCIFSYLRKLEFGDKTGGGFRTDIEGNCPGA
jgi:hypothetical protein